MYRLLIAEICEQSYRTPSELDVGYDFSETISYRFIFIFLIDVFFRISIQLLLVRVKCVRMYDTDNHNA